MASGIKWIKKLWKRVQGDAIWDGICALPWWKPMGAALMAAVAGLVGFLKGLPVWAWVLIALVVALILLIVHVGILLSRIDRRSKETGSDDETPEKDDGEKRPNGMLDIGSQDGLRQDTLVSPGRQGYEYGPPPTVSIRYIPTGIPRGFEYHNAGPGTAFDIQIAPLSANGYKATFRPVSELREKESSEPHVAHVETEGDRPGVRGDDLNAIVGEVPLTLVLTYEDGVHRRHREEYAISADFFGQISLLRRRKEF